MAYHTSAEVFDQAHGWQWRVLLASFPADPMGALVRAVLGRNMKNGMAYLGTAVIGKDAIVRASVRDRDGRIYRNMPIGPIITVRDEFRRLADHCRLPDHEREALFEELRKWICEDHRAESGLDVRRHN